MFTPSTKISALLMSLLSMVCWGSWGNFLVFAGERMRFELFYVNYSIGAFLVALLGAVSLGNVKTDGHRGDRTFADDFSDIGSDRYIFAFLAGLVFSTAILALCKGIAMLGLALAFPLCIGTALVLGTVLTYVIKPSGDAALLFLGVFVAFCAVCAAAFMYRLKEQQQRDAREKGAQAESYPVSAKGEPTMTRKVAVCILGGVLMGCWNPIVALAGEDPGLSPYASFVLFTAAIALSGMVLLPLVIAFPLEGGPGDSVREVLGKWTRTPAVCHAYGFLGGAVWALGTLANVVAGDSKQLNSAGIYAIGQCANVAAICWGIFLFREFKGTDLKVKGLIVTVLILYGTAIALISLAG